MIGLTSDVLDPKIILGFLNSSLISYFLFHNSAQIGKGTYNMLNANELENIPIPSKEFLSSDLFIMLLKVTEKALKLNQAPQKLLTELNEIVFNIYNLKEYEKQRIRDFFNIEERKNQNSLIVNNNDFYRYGERFRRVFKFILRDDKFLNAEAFFSPTFGACITFSIVDIELGVEKIHSSRGSVLPKIINSTANAYLKIAEKEKIIKQEKLKLYTEKTFTIVKSNYYQDWTETEAIIDSKEEIELFVQSLPDK